MSRSQPASARDARPRRTAAQTREHLLTVASELFYQDGVRATGVDTVAARAGVAPPTLYRLFATKDDLVAAYIQRCSDAYKQQLHAATAPAAGTVRERILAVVTLFIEDATSSACRGCPFLLVLAEYPDPASPAHTQAVAHKAWVRTLLHELVAELAAESRIDDPTGLAEQLTLLAEGIYAAVQALGPSGPARHALAGATTLLDRAART